MNGFLEEICPCLVQLLKNSRDIRAEHQLRAVPTRPPRYLDSNPYYRLRIASLQAAIAPSALLPPNGNPGTGEEATACDAYGSR